MTALKNMLIEEKERSIRQKKLALKTIDELPKGNIVYKKIKNRKYPYLQWKEEKKTISKYIKNKDLEEIKLLIKRREEAKKLLSIARENLEIIERALNE